MIFLLSLVLSTPPTLSERIQQANEQAGMNVSPKPFIPLHPPLIVLSDYGRQLQTSVKEKRVLVVGVRCNPPSGNWITCRVDDQENFPKGSYLVVSKGGNWLKQLPPNATAADVHSAFCTCGRDCPCPNCDGNCPVKLAPPPLMQLPFFQMNGSSSC